MDENEFFRKATLRMCGQLEIEEGLRACVEYVSRHIPADVIYLERYERDLGAIQLLARATPDCGEKMDGLIPLPEEAREKMDQLTRAFKSGKLPPVLIFNKPEEEPIPWTIQQARGDPLSSVMSLLLFLDDQLVGFFCLLAKGNDRYNDEHADLFATLREPLFVAMSNTLKHREVLKLKNLLADDNRYLHGELRRLSGDEIVGANYGLRDVMMKVQQVAPIDSPVLLLGETGVGKDVIANAIHQSSPRRDKSFIRVNCGAIPETLIDSELFGHEKGAFTGALSQKRGLFERADKGTILLDEIGDLPLQAQVRLLRVLQNSEIERVGGTEIIKLDIRVIAATHRNLEAMVNEDIFREDLWFRLNVFPIWIPPLRERRSDIPSLLQHFINLKARELKLPAIPTLSRVSFDNLMDYNWPGNVREIQNIVERALIINPKGPLTFEHLNLKPPVNSSEEQEQKTEAETLNDVTSRHIKSVLSITNGKINGPDGAAVLLGINPNTLRHRMNKLGIEFGRGSKG